MPRHPRVHAPDSIYHVVSRGVEKRPIFLDTEDNRRFLIYLKEGLSEFGAELLAYCLMTNHYHALIAIREVPLSVIMQAVLGRYALYFNKKYERVGHLFQGRYHAEICRNNGYLIQVIAYIHLNPVEAGIAKTPGEWPWSSHDELVSGRPVLTDIGRLVELSGFTPEDIRALYLEKLSDDAVPKEGIAALEARIRRTAEKYGVSEANLRSSKRGEALSRAREELAAWAVGAGVTDAQVAAALHCARSAVTRARKRQNAAAA
jgi:putative transposase